MKTLDRIALALVSLGAICGIITAVVVPASLLGGAHLTAASWTVIVLGTVVTVAGLAAYLLSYFQGNEDREVQIKFSQAQAQLATS